MTPTFWRQKWPKDGLDLVWMNIEEKNTNKDSEYQKHKTR